MNFFSPNEFSEFSVRFCCCSQVEAHVLKQDLFTFEFFHLSSNKKKWPLLMVKAYRPYECLELK